MLRTASRHHAPRHEPAFVVLEFFACALLNSFPLLECIGAVFYSESGKDVMSCHLRKVRTG